jgi:hypothetical protein
VEQDLYWEVNYFCLNIVLMAEGRMIKWARKVIHGMEDNYAQNFVRKNLNNVHEHKTRILYPVLDFTDTGRASFRLSQPMWLQGCTIWWTPLLCHIYSVCKLLHLCIVSSGIHVSSTHKITFAWGADMF